MNKKQDGTLENSWKGVRYSDILVHHYCHAKYLFQTVTMYPAAERDQAMASMVQHKSWYGGRFATQNRNGYLQRRLRAEEQMYQEFSHKYWMPKERCPVYFYLYPHFSRADIQTKLDQRQKFDEPHTKFLLIPLAELEEDTHISFTISDSLISYREKLVSQGVHFESASPRPEVPKYPEHGSIFHIREITAFKEKYAHRADLNFEVQIWDTALLRAWQTMYAK